MFQRRPQAFALGLLVVHNEQRRIHNQASVRISPARISQVAGSTFLSADKNLAGCQAFNELQIASAAARGFSAA
jgi:hypothetical protein